MLQIPSFPSPARLLAVLAAASLLLPAALLAADDIPRLPNGKPDMSGTYDVATLTPLMRSGRFGDKAELTEKEAKEYAEYWANNLAKDAEKSDPNREAPEVGGTDIYVPEFAGAAGGVGGYNAFYVDIGDNMYKIDGKYRTSIIVDPPNGRFPKTVPAAMERAKANAVYRHKNTGTAWWREKNLDVGPYDDPELRDDAERCLMGFGSTAGPPALPVMYNNMKRIVQTEDKVVIVNEMNHDARVVRMNSEHVDPEIRSWLGDSIGWWDGDVLVVETTNFNDSPALFSATRDLKVTERFRRDSKDRLIYSFTVEDPGTWSAPWSGEYPWPVADGKMYEYACHEGNYALGGILRGARVLEEDFEKGIKPPGSTDDD